MWETDVRLSRRVTGNWWQIVQSAAVGASGRGGRRGHLFFLGTTGFPKAILHNHESLMQAAQMEQKHHQTSRDDVFLCIPPLYHTGAKFHWMGSLCAGSRAVLLTGTTPEIILDAVSKERCTIVWLLVPWLRIFWSAGQRQDKAFRLPSGSVEADAYWSTAGTAFSDQTLEEIFSKSEYDTNYGLSESHGPGMCAPWYGQYRQGRSDRYSRIPWQ